MFGGSQLSEISEDEEPMASNINERLGFGKIDERLGFGEIFYVIYAPIASYYLL